MNKAAMYRLFRYEKLFANRFPNVGLKGTNNKRRIIIKQSREVIIKIKLEGKGTSRTML